MMRQRGRSLIIIVMLISLVASGLARYANQKVRQSATGVDQLRGDMSTGSSIGSMNSYALALLLGGMRGPLVMMLWQQSETQKQERNLDGLDTTIEWIRLLQPEYDTVHLFQVWNKAYNISVLNASVRNKYITILDALDYAHKIDQARPDNINTLSQIGRIFFDKFGNSAEKELYRRWVRTESMPHPVRQRLPRNDPAWRRLDMDAIVDAKGELLPDLIKPRITTSATTQPVYDGSELQFLKPFAPFPYGVSPLAISYNYAKRAQLLQRDYKQHHAQLSEIVISAGPALSLKFWSGEESELGRRLECKALGAAEMKERLDMELTTSEFGLDHAISDASALQAAIAYYDRAAGVARSGINEYNEHIAQFRENLDNTQSQRTELDLAGYLMAGDRDYLRAMSSSGADRESFLRQARDNYQHAVRRTALIILSYYIEQPVRAAMGDRLPPREMLPQLPDEVLDRLLNEAMAETRRQLGPDYRNDDRREFDLYFVRSINRIQQCAKLLAK